MYEEIYLEEVFFTLVLMNVSNSEFIDQISVYLFYVLNLNRRSPLQLISSVFPNH